MATTELFTTLAEQALRAYPVQVEATCYLGHSDNLTFRVETVNDGLYLLRLHEPVAFFYRGIRQLPEVIASELVWMEALAREGGFQIQQPIYTRAGDLLGSVVAPEGETIPTTLLSWLEGEHFSPAVTGAEQLVERFGELVGQMHNFASGWNAPPGFIRPTYDYDHFSRIFTRLLRGVDVGIFSEAIYRILHKTGQRILELIAQMPEDPQNWGMIHADLHVGNFLVHGGEVVPIDFSFCGFGHYLFDVSVCLAGGLKPNHRLDFLRGYRSQRPLPESDLRLVEAYALAGRVSYFAYQIENPTERRWLEGRIPQVAEGVCLKFLQDAPILSDL